MAQASFACGPDPRLVAWTWRQDAKLLSCGSRSQLFCHCSQPTLTLILARCTYDPLPNSRACSLRAWLRLRPCDRRNPTSQAFVPLPAILRICEHALNLPSNIVESKTLSRDGIILQQLLFVARRPRNVSWGFIHLSGGEHHWAIWPSSWKEGKTRGKKFEWTVVKWHKPSIKFHHSVGAEWM